jgi:hypothetical protein
MPASKKPSTTTRKPPTVKKTAEIDEELAKKLIAALNSPALNGGFDTLVTKVDSIELIQGQQNTTIDHINEGVETLSGEVSEIHDAIYDPDEGLYARVKDAESNTKLAAESFVGFKENVEKELVKDDQSDDELWEKFNEADKQRIVLEGKVDNMISSRERTSSIIKWVATTIGGSAITILAKVVYDILSAL